MSTRFTLDGPRAHAALTRHQRREKWRPEIPADWCAAFDSEGRVADLVGGAIKHGVLTCPPDTTIQFVIEDSGGGEDYYQWQVVISKPAYLIVGSHWTSLAKLGNGDTSGIRGPEEAISVLDDAIMGGNAALARLAQYVRAVTG